MRTNHTNTRLFTLTSIATLAFICARTASAQTTTRESVDSNGIELSQGSTFPALSADGRHVAFSSSDFGLVPGFGNGTWQIFTRDRQTGQVQAVSISMFGGTATGGFDPLPCSISADGRFIAFASSAGDLVAGDTNSTYDVFVRDTLAGVTTRVSVSSSGAQGNQFSGLASISADGRCVCFQSNASNLVANDTNGQTLDVFVHDRLTGTTEIASLTASGAQAGGLSIIPFISADGSSVLFGSSAVDVVPGDTNGRTDVFVRDRVLGVTERVSLDSNGVEANGNSAPNGLSGDGRYVLFSSLADNLVAGDLNLQPDAFVRDRLTGSTVRANLGFAGEELATGATSGPSAISTDGRYVGFVTYEAIAPGDAADFSDVFVRDLTLAQTACVSCRPNGQVGNRASKSPALSADGRFVAFETDAKNLVMDDMNGARDVLVRDMHNTVGPPLLDYNGPGKLNSAGCFPSISASGAASVAGPMSLFAVGLGFIDQKPGVLLWGNAPASIPFHGGNLSVAAPRVRFTATNSSAPAGTSACLGRLSVHFDASYLAAHNLQPGDDVYAQFIARDPGYAPPDNYALSDGLHFVVQP